MGTVFIAQNLSYSRIYVMFVDLLLSLFSYNYSSDFSVLGVANFFLSFFFSTYFLFFRGWCLLKILISV